ncbi:hypothetical protein BT93_H3692 [Corymbia citriodora subsp. variegata]|nr:hypothetical protein BT93_H3692 [Corymbia citriodora subsp. variegata]KAF8018877.1 hypothetical protein BT93_H3692 [Corymbia citriodora subsp. variegata]
MEYKKQGSSSSSFTADIFGAKESPPSSSSTGVFASIFPSPQSVVGTKSSPEIIGYRQKHHNENQVWNSKQGNPGPERASCNTTYKDGSIFREERGEPCHLSSSIYYGGRDVYSQPPGAQTSASYPILKKDGVEDDQNGTNSVSGASRGNWWQGSLYY